MQNNSVKVCQKQALTLFDIFRPNALENGSFFRTFVALFGAKLFGCHVVDGN